MRKTPVRVDQKSYLEYLNAYGPQTLGDLARIFHVHVSTARRKLEGLVYQGKVRREWRSPWTASLYWVDSNPPQPVIVDANLRTTRAI